MTQAELIESLPGDLRPWGELWLPVLLRWSEAELTEFLANAAVMPWLDAYKQMIKVMTTDEVVAELKMHNAELERLNKDNAAFVQAQRTLFFSLLAKLILSLAQ